MSPREVILKRKKDEISKKVNIVFIIFTLCLLSCQLKPISIKTNNMNVRSINALEIEHEPVNTQLTQIPLKTMIKFEVCLEDKSLINTSFIVKGPSIKVNSKTNSDACLIWDESLEFYSLKQEQYFLLNRTITSQENNLITSLKIGVNPWSDSVYDILDLRKGFDEIERPVAAEKEMNQPRNGAKFAIHQDSINLFTDFLNNQYEYNLNFTPVLITKGLDGEDKIIQLHDAEFDMNFRIYQRFHGDESIEESFDSVLKASNGQINKSFMVKNDLFAKDKIVAFDLKLSTKNLPKRYHFEYRSSQFFNLLLEGSQLAKKDLEEE